MKKLLSICIPVHNRLDIFRHCLFAACEASLNYTHDVEIVISDNASEDNLMDLVDSFKLNYSSLRIVYERNELNIGMSRNFLKVVDLSRAEYCWIIGSDDFIKKESIGIILKIIRENSNLDFISCNYDLIYIDKLNMSTLNYKEFTCKLNNPNLIELHKSPSWEGMVERFDLLIDPIFNNVFLGAMMTGIFRKSIWDSVDKEHIDWDGFNSLTSLYPHCYIYAKGFIGTQAYYCGKPIITVGEGTREWSTDGGIDFWESHLPLIYFNILSDMLETYKKSGLKRSQYMKSLEYTAQLSGNLLLQVIKKKHFRKDQFKNSKQISVTRALIYNFKTLSFYRAILSSLIISIKNVIKIR